jgi:hypothetical protein
VFIRYLDYAFVSFVMPNRSEASLIVTIARSSAQVQLTCGSTVLPSLSAAFALSRAKTFKRRISTAAHDHIRHRVTRHCQDLRGQRF